MVQSIISDAATPKDIKKLDRLIRQAGDSAEKHCKWRRPEYYSIHIHQLRIQKSIVRCHIINIKHSRTHLNNALIVPILPYLSQRKSKPQNNFWHRYPTRNYKKHPNSPSSYGITVNDFKSIINYCIWRNCTLHQWKTIINTMIFKEAGNTRYISWEWYISTRLISTYYLSSSGANCYNMPISRERSTKVYSEDAQDAKPNC